MAIKFIGLIHYSKELDSDRIIDIATEIVKKAADQKLGLLLGKNAYSFEHMMTDVTAQLNFEITSTLLSSGATKLFDPDAESDLALRMEEVSALFTGMFEITEVESIEAWTLDPKQSFYPDECEEIELISRRFGEAVTDELEESGGQMHGCKFAFMDKTAK